mmetsp:Transcript_26514/g.87916  ORF Transcript_26514/g.87916 Transcript_26514/m.87916 type:complete len:239 (+) Transcript_26514:64-780(+)
MSPPIGCEQRRCLSQSMGRLRSRSIRLLLVAGAAACLSTCSDLSLGPNFATVGQLGAGRTAANLGRGQVAGPASGRASDSSVGVALAGARLASRPSRAERVARQYGISYFFFIPITEPNYEIALVAIVLALASWAFVFYQYYRLWFTEELEDDIFNQEVLDKALKTRLSKKGVRNMASYVKTAQSDLYKKRKQIDQVMIAKGLLPAGTEMPTMPGEEEDDGYIFTDKEAEKEKIKQLK